MKTLVSLFVLSVWLVSCAHTTPAPKAPECTPPPSHILGTNMDTCFDAAAGEQKFCAYAHRVVAGNGTPLICSFLIGRATCEADWELLFGDCEAIQGSNNSIR